ncbi:1-phosphofructokinase [Bacillus lacus]|uniref:Tagatose-6-phosphate kinase n=1 Tax=Metabacillus lacus TaxID=1983721 RepID=A0A7X2LZQ9_9BACI|nr:1-phosphofructokinase [Metabacillus lacus]MRX73701.1 1-phosphofructokinase [Metabacillus lacus]
MIYTLTLNPSLDYMIEADNVSLGKLNRTTSEAKFPGGKGINVSRVLNAMGVESRTLGFIGGFTGEFIENALIAEGIQTSFVKVAADTRINVKLKAEQETEFNAKGPDISSTEYNNLISKIRSLSEGDMLVLAGSIPSSLSEQTYEELIQLCKEQKTEFVVDAEGELLKKILHYQPFLIKPNHHELGQFFQADIISKKQAAHYAKQLVELGAKHVIVSLAGEGAVYVNSELTLFAEVPKGEVKSSVGAGDSMVAGFLSAYQKTKDPAAAFQYSTAAGSATAFSIGLCTDDKVQQLLSQIKIEKKA